jgi:hypothetical protein
VSACDVREFSISALTPELFSVETFSANVRLVVFPVPPAVCFCSCGMTRRNHHLQGQLPGTTVRTVADPCPQNFLSVIVVWREASYCKSRPTPLINRFFCRLWRSSHVWTRSHRHNHSNIRPSKVCSVIFVKYIIFIFIRFVLLYYYNAFGAYVILLLFFLLYLLLLFFFVNITVALLACLSRHLL